MILAREDYTDLGKRCTNQRCTTFGEQSLEHTPNGAQNQWSTGLFGAPGKWGTGPNGAQGQPNIFSPLDLYFFHDRKNHIQSKLGFATIGNPTAISSGNHYNSIINDKRPWLHNPKILRLVRFQ